ncbi:hypothetical protein Sulac_0673 [Sulfobacillus acidophilus DSM 10332]|uniref:Uncharacterized protein n=1 Tax=Sulfobacillus acidophilus (strain ATCC 700253 / DSM 10332 / NAL) TaxID=679936 RepID=G8U014_SULAD|nr:hypothetical protein Sulac_0673 [Sulfobacillus acidophilus DSM 10332]
MAISLETDLIQTLIDEFVTVSRHHHAQAWRLWELAAAIYDAGGPTGLHRLAHVTHYAYSTLRGWAAGIGRFSPALRAQFPTLSPDLFRTADWARRQFTGDRPEATMEYWLTLTATEHLTRDALRARVLQRRDQVPLTDDVTGHARQQQLIRMADRAIAAAEEIERLASEFNAKYKAYALFTLDVTRTPYVPA